METVPLRHEELVANPRDGEVHLSDPYTRERPGLDLVHAGDRLKILCHGLDPSVGGCYVCAVATILLAGVDVFFRGKLESLLPEHRLTTTDSVDPPELVICDVSRIEPEEVADAYPEIPILGFTNHTDTAGLRAAKTAGFDQVVVKSALVERGRDLVGELLASLE